MMFIIDNVSLLNQPQSLSTTTTTNIYEKRDNKI